MSASVNSRAKAPGPITARCTFKVSASPASSTALNHGLSGSASQPASVSEPAAASEPLKKLRRSSLSLLLGRMMRLVMAGSCRLDGVVAGDHRAHVVPDAGQDHHHDVHEHEQHGRSGAEKMDAARRLSA